MQLRAAADVGAVALDDDRELHGSPESSPAGRSVGASSGRRPPDGSADARPADTGVRRRGRRHGQRGFGAVGTRPHRATIVVAGALADSGRRVAVVADAVVAAVSPAPEHAGRTGWPPSRPPRRRPRRRRRRRRRGLARSRRAAACAGPAPSASSAPGAAFARAGGGGAPAASPADTARRLRARGRGARRSRAACSATRPASAGSSPRCPAASFRRRGC